MDHLHLGVDWEGVLNTGHHFIAMALVGTMLALKRIVSAGCRGGLRRGETGEGGEDREGRRGREGEGVREGGR